MDIDFLSWEIKEPVKSRPMAGGLCGLVTGAFFGLVASQAGRIPASGTVGYILGGTIAGVLIGALLPLFRSRLAAGVVVSIAATSALLIIHRFSNPLLPPEASIFFGCSTGLAYAVLFWKYSRR